MFIAVVMQLLAYDFNSDNNGPASDLVTTSILMLYGTTENIKIVLFYFLNK